MHVRRISRQRYLTRPLQRWPATVPRLKERATVFGHLSFGERALRHSGQHLLYEHVFIKHQRLALGRTDSLQGGMETLGKIGQRQRRDERLHIGNGAHTLLVAKGPVEAQGTAPVVVYQCHSARPHYFVNECFQIAGLAHEAIAVGFSAWGILSESPMPIRSGAIRRRPERSTSGNTLRHRNAMRRPFKGHALKHFPRPSQTCLNTVSLSRANELSKNDLCRVLSYEAFISRLVTLACGK